MSLFPAVAPGMPAGKLPVKDEKEHAAAEEKSVEKILFMVKPGESIVCWIRRYLQSVEQLKRGGESSVISGSQQIWKSQ